MARKEKITSEIDCSIVEQSLADISYKEVVPAPMKITMEVSYEMACTINDSARKNNTAFEVEATMIMAAGIRNREVTRKLMESEAGRSLTQTLSEDTSEE